LAEVPHKAKQGQSYKMLVKPNCRWASGACDLINGALKIHITADTQAYGLKLSSLFIIIYFNELYNNERNLKENV
jgi:hypothetical protein